MKKFSDLPKAESCRRIDFEAANVHPGSVPGSYVLVVSGMKPYCNMSVTLIPRIYIIRPEYWGIEVVGCLPGIGLPALAPYSESIPLDGILGTEGIEVIGAHKSKKIKVPPKAGGTEGGKSARK